MVSISRVMKTIDDVIVTARRSHSRSDANIWQTELINCRGSLISTDDVQWKEILTGLVCGYNKQWCDKASRFPALQKVIG